MYKVEILNTHASTLFFNNIDLTDMCKCLVIITIELYQGYL